MWFFPDDSEGSGNTFDERAIEDEKDEESSGSGDDIEVDDDDVITYVMKNLSSCTVYYFSTSNYENYDNIANTTAETKCFKSTTTTSSITTSISTIEDAIK